MPVNMSYCRFQNTLAALRECADTLAESESSDPLAGFSDDEREAANRLFQLCRRLADDYGDDDE